MSYNVQSWGDLVAGWRYRRQGLTEVICLSFILLEMNVFGLQSDTSNVLFVFSRLYTVEPLFVEKSSEYVAKTQHCQMCVS